MQGLQNVAQKLKIVGASAFLMAEVSSVNFHFGIYCAFELTPRIMKITRKYL